MDEHSYKEILVDIARTHPLMAKVLSYAEENRATRLKQYFSGVRLAGFEELLAHLDAVQKAFEKDKSLQRIRFLITRTRGDFVTALEALLSGFHSVAHDAMRDVMEIEFLLREFSYEPDQIEIWLSSNLKQLNDRFRPAVLRQRHAVRIKSKPQDLAEATDYKAHSMFLHVNTVQNPFGGPGLSPSRDTFTVDSCFWEVFEHARRILTWIDQLSEKIAPGLLADLRPEALERIGKAWERTQEMQQIWQGLLKIANKTEDEGDDV